MMEPLLTALAAAADPTRLRVLALAAGGVFCVSDFCEILGQSQPRLSRHLKLLCDAGLLERSREGASAWFRLAQGVSILGGGTQGGGTQGGGNQGGRAQGVGTQGGGTEGGGAHVMGGALARDILRHMQACEPVLAADRRGAARVLAERARAASEKFRRDGADWDEMRALSLPADAVEAALLDMLPQGQLGRVLDVGTGTGRLLELLAPRCTTGLGVDASRTMLALARVRLARHELGHCSVRMADMYALPLPDSSFDLVLLQMVLHYAEEPAAVVEEARRVLAPGGRLVVVDLARHANTALLAQMGHRSAGFSDAEMLELFGGAGLLAASPVDAGGTAASPGEGGALRVRIWQGTAPADIAAVSEAVFA